MINYTPNHEYTEITDKTNSNWKRILVCFIVTGALALFYMFLPCIVAVLLTILSLIFGFIVLIILSFQHPSKSKTSEVIKKVIGFDFDDDFKLLYTSSHDYEEHIYTFSESSFKPLKQHLESMRDVGVIGRNGRVIRHRYKDHQFSCDFYLCDNRLEGGVCGNVESIEVDYTERTLKHIFVIY